MSFFGLGNNDLEEEKRKFLQGGLREEEDIAVYNWGSEDYDGLGNALQEGGDDLNDETFGDSGPVGKDFDFTAQAFPNTENPVKHRTLNDAHHHKEPPVQLAPVRPSQPARSTTNSRESIWDDKSPFSVLRSAGSLGRRAGSATIAQSVAGSSTPVQRFTTQEQQQSPAVTQHNGQVSEVPQLNSALSTGSINYAAPGVRTLQEIEAEMRAQTQLARTLHAQQQYLQAQQAQEEQQRQVQLQLHHQHMKPPRMRSQSPFTNVAQSNRVQSPSIAYQQQVLEQREQLRMEELERQMREQALLSQQELRSQQLQPDMRDLYLQQASRQQAYRQHQSSVPPRMDAQQQHQRVPSNNSAPSVVDIQIFLQQQQQQQLAQQAAIGYIDSPADLARRASPLRHAQSQQMRLAMANQVTNQHQAPSGAANANQMAEIAQIQMQQRRLAQSAHQEFSQKMDTGGINGQATGANLANTNTQEKVKLEAMRRIMEAERQEAKRRRKAAKIAHMSRYNDLMTQSDKDFITRIQVSQLVTSDPYTEDFYAQVYGSLLRSRMGINSGEERVLKFGSGEGVGLGISQRGGGRRPNAMQRMEAQVERIVNNARQREKEKGLHAIHSLQGALGKTAGRSYKAAPRQLLQVDTNGTSDPSAPHGHGHISKEDAKESAAGAAKEAAKRGREALGGHADINGIIHKDPLTRKEALAKLEALYDTLLHVEQMRREQPSPDDQQKAEEWAEIYASETQKLWDGLQVMVPLETSDPHPFISLMIPAKGKRLLPRLTRHLNPQQMLTLLTLLVACFAQLDVVKDAALLDSQVETPERSEIDKQTQIFVSTVLQSILPIIAKANLRLIGGLLGLLMERCEVNIVVQCRPGLSLLIAFLSRVEVIKSDMTSGVIDPSEMPSEEDLISWQNIFDHLFHILTPHLVLIFPSSRNPFLKSESGVSTAAADLLDQPAWKFLATVSLQASNEQQQVLVTTLREKILENVVAVNKSIVTDKQEQSLKITNVNIFLHSLGIDSSQIHL